jgi:hypothetical protein
MQANFFRWRHFALVSLQLISQYMYVTKGIAGSEYPFLMVPRKCGWRYGKEVRVVFLLKSTLIVFQIILKPSFCHTLVGLPCFWALPLHENVYWNILIIPFIIIAHWLIFSLVFFIHPLLDAKKIRQDGTCQWRLSVHSWLSLWVLRIPGGFQGESHHFKASKEDYWKNFKNC